MKNARSLVGAILLFGVRTAALGQSGLVGWYSFDGPNQPGLDSVGSNHGTPSGVSQVPGVRGLAASFSNGWIQLPPSPVFNFLNQDFTVAVFVKGLPGNTNRNWFSKSIANQTLWTIGSNSTTGISFDSGGTPPSDTVVFDGAWHHVLAVKRGSTAETWIDGRLEKTGGISLNSTVDGGSIGLGRLGECCEFFNGQMDEAKIWNRALSAAEIAAEATQTEIPLETFFDGFGPNSYAGYRQLHHWGLQGSDKPGGCTLPQNPGPTTFCSQPEYIDTSVAGELTLRGDVAGGTRKGSALNFISASKLPPVGTFAARVRLPDDGDYSGGHASIKAFFTYRSGGETNRCVHIEHDFEAFSGPSPLYRDSGDWSFGWGQFVGLWDLRRRDWSDDRTIMSNVTHTKYDSGAICSERKLWNGLRLLPGLPALDVETPKFAMKRGLDDLKADGYITLMVTVQCDSPCSGPVRWYTSSYYAGPVEARYELLGRSRSQHRLEATNSLDPLFNLWWIKPGSAGPLFGNAATQSMTIDWFYWNRNILPFGVVHRSAQACDALSDTASNSPGPNTIAGGGCPVQ